MSYLKKLEKNSDYVAGQSDLEKQKGNYSTYINYRVDYFSWDRELFVVPKYSDGIIHKGNNLFKDNLNKKIHRFSEEKL